MEQENTLHTYPPCRFLVYSDPMVGKSTFAATFPRPIRVECFDPYLKDSPYLAKGYYDEPGEYEDGTPFRDVTDEDGKLLIRINYFHDETPERPTAFKRFMRHVHGFGAGERKQWATWVIDSTSAMSRACKLMHQFDLSPDYKDPRKWYADTADSMENMLTRFASVRDVNLVLLAHISRKMDDAAGSILRTIKLPGRLGMDGPDSFPEIYRIYMDKQKGTPVLQTRRGADSWLAGSQFIGAPNPCEPRYGALWSNFMPRTRPRPGKVQQAEAATATDGASGDARTEECVTNE